jgi:putative transcriptional regulator
MKTSRKKDGTVLHTRLPMLRTERSISRKALAEMVGVHPQTIGYIERGEYSPSLELGFKIAKVFELPIEAIFSLEPFATLDATALTTS